jgi:hypothetical protein
METAAYFARKHGLEEYLDRPSQLNEMILKVLVLQEAMQREQARKAAANPSGRNAFTVRRKTIGSFTARCTGDPAYGYAAETALKGSTATVPLFQRGRFVALLRQMGVPEQAIEELCSTVVLEDDTHCFDPE